MRALGCTLVALGGWWWVAGAVAQEAEGVPAPELDFLEYLGAWAAEDDEWLAIEEWQKDNPDEGKDADDTDPKRQRNANDESE